MLCLRIAYKYLRSKKSHSVVNLIARTAVISIAIPVAAAILVLSLQKGLSNYIETLYNDFDPQLKISRADHSAFTQDSLLFHAVRSTSGVSNASEVVQGEVLLEYTSQNRYVATIKGVDANFTNVVPITKRVTHGTYQTTLGDLDQIIIGQGIAYYMGVNPALKKKITLYSLSASSPSANFGVNLPNYNSLTALPVAIFTIDEATDSRYLISSLTFAQKLLRKNGEITSIDVAVDSNANLKEVQKKLAEILPPDFAIATREEQHASLLRIMNIERWIIFILLTMITALASLTLCGTIIMMKTEKKTQNQALLQMGLRPKRLRNIFTNLGMIITLSGLCVGIILGAALVLVQAEFGLLKMSGESLLLDAYPVSLDLANIAYLIVATCVIGYIISLLTSRIFKNI